MSLSKYHDTLEDEKLRKDDYNFVFGSEEGQRVLSDIIRSCHMLSPTYFPGDPHQTAFQEGERNFALKILTNMNVRPEHFRNYIKE